MEISEDPESGFALGKHMKKSREEVLPELWIYVKNWVFSTAKS
jgi:hypothetical protein